MLGVHTVISKLNVHRIPDIEREARAIFRPDSYIAEVAENRVELKTMDKDITPADRRLPARRRPPAQRHPASTARRHPVARLVESLRLEYYELAARILEEKRQVIDCYAGWASAHLAPDGHVWGCCVRAESLGNVRDHGYDFRTVWRGGEADAFRASVRPTSALPARQRELHQPAARRPVAGAGDGEPRRRGAGGVDHGVARYADRSRADRGLGTAYAALLLLPAHDRWAAEYDVQSALEGPVDGMAGVRGVHCVGLAREGVSVVAAGAERSQRGDRAATSTRPPPRPGRAAGGGARRRPVARGRSAAERSGARLSRAAVRR